jgi:hypothetical protein
MSRMTQVFFDGMNCAIARGYDVFGKTRIIRGWWIVPNLIS